MADSEAVLEHQFDDFAQQTEAARLGMWTFLVTEIMFFGGLFTAYIYYRSKFLEGFIEGSHHSDVLLGSINTAVLICSSLTMAVAVHGAEERNRRRTIAALLATMAVGTLFLAIKAVEYYHHYQEGVFPGLRWEAQGEHVLGMLVFMSLYAVMTGLHALHMIAGIGVMAVLVAMIWRGRLPLENPNSVEMTGLYWHFVDIVWIFLFPLLYLIGAHQ